MNLAKKQVDGKPGIFALIVAFEDANALGVRAAVGCQRAEWDGE